MARRVPAATFAAVVVVVDGFAVTSAPGGDRLNHGRGSGVHGGIGVGGRGGGGDPSTNRS